VSGWLGVSPRGIAEDGLAMPKIAVQLVDDQAVVRAGLKMLIDCQPDMEVVGEAAGAKGAILLARACQPTVTLIEIGLRDGDGIKAIGGILEAAPRCRVLVLSTYDDPAHLRQALEGGAAGYVAKRATDAEVMTAIRAVAGGQTYANVSLAETGAPESLDSSPGTPGPVKAQLESLSPREREALTFLVLGYTNKEIAARFNLSVKSVETYRRRVSEKLGAAGRADLVRFAIEAGLLPGSAELPNIGPCLAVSR